MKRNVALIFIVLVVWGMGGIVFCAEREPSANEVDFGFKLYLYNFYGVTSIEDKKVCGVGNAGTICLSEDGGRNWRVQDSGVKMELYDVKFAGPLTGWVVGRFGTILRSDDGGKSWGKLNSGTKVSLLSLCVVDEVHLWTVGEWGAILHSEDGRTWTRQGAKSDKIYNDIFFVDPTHGWVVGEFGTILHTKDGGKIWDIQQSPLGKTSLFSVFFKDRQRGWAVSMDGHIIATVNGGENWAELISPTNKTLLDIKVIGNRGFAFGLEGTFIISNDGGKTWDKSKTDLGTLSWVCSSSFLDGKLNGWIAGGNGTLLYTTDGGHHWDLPSLFFF